MCVVFHVFLVELQDKKEDTLLNTEHFTVDADAVGGHGTGSSVLSAFRSTALVEEDGRYCTLQATGSTLQGSAALDSQLDLASVCGRLPNFLGDVKAVLPLSGVEFAQESMSQSGLHEQCESCYSDGTEKAAQKKKSNGRSGMCAEKASSGVPGDLSRQHVFGPGIHRSSQCTSANTAAQQSYKVSSVLESGISHDGAKGRKELLENPEILPSVRKKSRTLYSAGK